MTKQTLILLVLGCFLVAGSSFASERVVVAEMQTNTS